MADVAALERALINADAAGDTAAAQVLASEITRVRASSSPKPNQYQQAAIDERDQLQSQGIDTGAGYTRRLAHGATFGADNTLLAAAQTPLEMIKRGTFDPREGYNFAKAREDLIMDDARKNTGALGTALEIGGGVGSGIGLARGGITFARGLAPEAGLLARSAASAGDAAAIGGFSGAMEGDGLRERGVNALKGAGIGAVAGGATPGALSILGAAASPIISNIRARVNPTGFAQSQVARGVSESGMTPQQIAAQVAQAGNEGQGMFTVADAMGNAGQRMLASTARAPGQARTDVVNFLDGRQAGQGRRISNTLAEGFESPQTAAQTEARLTTARDRAADAAYGAVRNDAGAVDVTRAVRHIDDTLGPSADQMLAHPGSFTPNDSIETVLQGFRNKIARVNPNDFQAVQRIRGDMSDFAQNAAQGGYGNKARLVRGAMAQLDTAMENASAGHLAANRNFAQASRDIEAVQAGRQAATRGRSEDTIPTFQAQSPQGQGAFRSGYVDPLIETAQTSAFGVNKARPLINDAFQAEAGAMAPGNPLMQRRIGRENTMFQTRNAATGNSKSIENAADDAAMGVDPTLVGQVLQGNWSGALRSVLASGSNVVSGNTPAVRQAVADILLTRGGNVNAAQFQRMIDQTVQRIQSVQNMARSLGRGASGGLAVAGPGQNRR